MTRFELAEFLEKVADAYPAFHPSGVPDNVIEGWYMALKAATPDEAQTALVRYISEDESGRKPAPKNIAKLISISPAKSVYKGRPDGDCPRCGGSEVVSYELEGGYQSFLDCICKGLWLGAPNAAIRKGNELYLRLLSEERLTNPPENRLLAREYFRQSCGEDLPY